MRYLDRIEEFFCGTALLSTTIILFANVVLRYVFKASTSWAEELIKYLMIWIAFIGGSICVRKGAHVSIDFFYDFISPKTKKIVSLVIYLISISFTAMMAYYGTNIIKFSMETNQVSPALQIPMWIPYLAIPLGFLLMSIRYIQKIIELINNRYESHGKGVD